MFYSEIVRETLAHINQYSVSGVPIASTYNGQADYLNRIPVFINEGIMNIRTLLKPEPVVHPLFNGEEYGDMLRYELPEDFWRLRTGGVSAIRDGKFVKTNEYRLQGKKYILLPNTPECSYTVEYYQYPNQLPVGPKLEDTFWLEEDREVVQTATFYAAANLVMHEDEFVYASLYNDYESRLARISNGVTAEVQPVQDAYSFGIGGL